MADLTAQQVWTDWRDYLSGFGYEVTAREQMAGDTLILRDVTLGTRLPEEDLSLRMTLDTMRLTQTGDGSVAVAFPSRMPMVIDGGPGTSARIDYTASGFDMVVSGRPDALIYDYSAAEMAMTLASLTESGAELDIGAARFGLTDMQGKTAVARGDSLRTTAQDLRAGALAYDVDITDPEGERLVFSGGMSDVVFEGKGATPLQFDSGDMTAMLAAGLDVSGRITYRDGALEYRVTDADGDEITGQNSSDSGTLGFGMNADGLHYDAGARNQSIAAITAELPLPLMLEMAEMGFALSMPVTGRAQVQDFALSFRLDDLVLPDMLWGMFDPRQMLPRDPATLILDLVGKGRLLADLMDPEGMEDMEDMDGPLPAELHALTLNDLTLSLAGASLSGLGAFTFDNSDLTSFEGFPAPQGALDLRLEGANALLDTLIGMGMIPEEDAMGVRMMMGIFAVPQEGEDTLTSHIEVNDQGQVLANGQRLR